MPTFHLAGTLALALALGTGAVGAAGAAAPTATAATPETAMARLSPTQARRLEAMLTTELQREVDAYVRGDGRRGGTRLTVRLDQARGVVVVDFDRRVLPGSNGATWETFTQMLDNAVYGLFGKDMPYRGTEFLIEGKRIQHYHPDPPRPARPAPLPRAAGPGVSATTVTPLVVVAAGHGRYYHHGTLEWRTQRETHNGVTEDFLTPGYANQVTQWLRLRTDAMVDNNLRSSSLEEHTPSTRPWNELATRYYLADRLPGEPGIWHSLPTSTATDRDYDEDIRSRPLYANTVGADTLIHLHSNGSETPSVRGTRVYVYPGRATDQALAERILCAMEEVIHAQPAYATFPVATTAHTGGHGENNFATMPSVIVELAFHTNATDAAALLDPVFRTAASKGIAKGYRLHTQGKPCTPLVITAAPPVAGPHNTDISVPIFFEGNPEPPLQIQTTTVTCPAGWSCVNYTTTIPSGPVVSPLLFNVRCTAPASRASATFAVSTVLVDADGVRSAPFAHSYTCTKP